jgi:hypothetical protein
MSAAPTLRRSPVPVSEPRAALRVIEPAPLPQPATQGILALALVDAHPQARAERAADAGADAEGFDPLPTPSAALPEPRAWAAQFVQAAVEVSAGARSPAQLVRWTAVDVHALLVRRWSLATRVPNGGAHLRRAAVVRAVRVCRPRDGVCEASAVVVDRGRVRAVALRMEGLDGRWRVMALDVG